MRTKSDLAYGRTLSPVKVYCKRGVLFVCFFTAYCYSDQWECDSGQCINEDYRCDGDDDCYDGSDEDGCGTGNRSPLGSIIMKRRLPTRPTRQCYLSARGSLQGSRERYALGKAGAKERRLRHR